jgi:hypothetical protein
MDVDNLVSVEVEYNHPEHNVRTRSVGWLLEGSQHLLLIHGTAKRADLYTYTVIPRSLINEINNLRVVDQ